MTGWSHVADVGSQGRWQVNTRRLKFLRSERVQKRNQISFLLGCKTNVETHVVKDDDICQRRGRAIVKVRCAACESPENGTLQFSDIRPLSGNKGATRISCLNGRVRGVVYQSEHREIANIQRAGHIAYTDIQWRRNGMVTHVGRIVASST